jgi:prolyl oligopeptidase
MEDLNDLELQEWVKQENKLSKKWLQKASNKYDAFHQIDKYACAKYKRPRKQGKFYFSYSYYNNFGVPALFYRLSLKEHAKMLVDPNYISKKDRILLKGHSLSSDSRYLAYQFSRNGSDWTEIKVVKMKNGIHTKDHLKNVKFSNIQWKGDGFFYSSFPQVNGMGETKGQQVFYHKLGTEQADDELIFKRKNSSLRFSVMTTSDENFMVLKERDEVHGYNNFFYIDYREESPHLKPLLMKQRYGITILDSHNGKFIAQTNHQKNNRYVIEIDPANPDEWREIVPENPKSLLQRIIPLREKIIAIYQSNQQPSIVVYNYKGQSEYKLELPVGSSVGGFSGEPDDEEFLFYFTSYTIPPVVYSFNIKTFKRKLVQRTSVTFDYRDIEYKQMEYLSRDGVKVPILLVYKKGLKLDGNNPAILKAYGGFGVVAKPHFDPGIVYFVKKGGVFAFANIRGGGDYGWQWAKQGRGKNKQNSFNDFIDAAQFLVDYKFTRPEKLASTGASNGGLVVAAAAIQRPDLFRAVVPVVGAFDMLRFEKFTVGHFHADEYGSVKDSLGFQNLRGYSPLHNINKEINYPAMLIMTSDHDDRVPPFHSYKFAASLQSNSAQKNPILLRVEGKAGHGGANGMYNTIRGMAFKYAFIQKILNQEPAL